MNAPTMLLYMDGAICLMFDGGTVIRRQEGDRYKFQSDSSRESAERYIRWMDASARAIAAEES